MKQFTVLNASGDVLRHGICADDEFDIQALQGETVVSGQFDAGHYFDGSAMQPKPQRPNGYHEWDAPAKAWVLPADYLSVAKLAAKGRINAAWKAAEKEPFAAYGKTFDADDKAVQRILGAAQAAMVAKSLGQSLSIEWTCADNSTLTMGADMLATIPIIIAQTADLLHQRYVALKAQIEAAETLEQVESITW